MLALLLARVRLGLILRRMAWLVLFASGVLETAWAVSLKQSDGFSKLGWTVAFAITAAASLAGLAYA